MSNRAQINSLLESLSGLALKIGLVLLGLSFAYMVYVIFGGKLEAKLSKDDAAYVVQSINIANLMFIIGAVAVVAASVIRFFSADTTGLIMTVVGGLLYFLSPAGFNALTLEAVHKNTLFLSILKQISTSGLICFAPGCLLLLKDIVVQIARIGSQRAPLLTEEEKAKGVARRRRSGKIYEKCWDMSVCNEHVKRVCPAWMKRRPCWQLKAGCLCDQDTIRRGLAERDRMQGGDLTQNARVETAPKVILSTQQKRERCRVCTVFCEHQRQKFRIASPIAIIAVLAAFGLTYSQVSTWLYDILGKTDRFMSFLTYRQGASSTYAAQGHIITTLAMICLAVVVVSMTLRLVEFLIFELQV